MSDWLKYLSNPYPVSLIKASDSLLSMWFVRKCFIVNADTVFESIISMPVVSKNNSLCLTNACVRICT